jgi:parallel beta-helix repeat protein
MAVIDRELIVDRRTHLPGRRSKKFVSLFLVVVIAMSLMAMTALLQPQESNDTTSEPPTPARIAYTTHDPIFIDGNAGFAGPNASTGVTKGSGTASDPYVIEGWEISFVSNGIEIANASVYFMIRDCNLNGVGGGWPSAAIYIHSSSNGTIMNCTCDDSCDGIYLDNSHSISLVNNSCSSNSFNGIFLVDSNNSILVGNNCSSGNSDAIRAYSSHGLSVIENVCFGNEYGIRVFDSDNISLVDNNFSSNTESGIEIEYCDNATLLNNHCLWDDKYGVMLRDCINATLRQNVLVGDGVYIGGNQLASFVTNSIDTTNTANGRPIYYYKNQNGISVPEGAGQVLMANCTNMNIEDQNLNDASVGIELAYCTEVKVCNNSCSSNYQGIVLYVSDGNWLVGNNCSNGWSGISLWGSSNSLINNICSSNSWCGVYLGYNSNGNSLIGDDFSNNNNGLVFDYGCEGNAVQMNRIENSVEYAINFRGGAHNTIWNNTFVGNNGAGATYDSSHVQAYDDGTNNWWNNTDGCGNYWGDWTTPDDNSDGIVDNPYNIDGSAGARDYYPMTATPQVIPEFSSNIVFLCVIIAMMAVVVGFRRFVRNDHN